MPKFDSYRGDFLKLLALGSAALAAEVFGRPPLVRGRIYEKNPDAKPLYERLNDKEKERYVEQQMETTYALNIADWYPTTDFPLIGELVGCQDHNIIIKESDHLPEINCVSLAKGFIDILGNPTSGYLPTENVLPRVGLASFNDVAYKGYQRGDLIHGNSHVIPVVYKTDEARISSLNSIQFVEPQDSRQSGIENFVQVDGPDTVMELYEFHPGSQNLISQGGYYRNNNTGEYQFVSRRLLSFIYQISNESLAYYMSEVYQNPELQRADLASFSPEEVSRFSRETLSMGLYGSHQLQWSLDHALYSP